MWQLEQKELTLTPRFSTLNSLRWERWMALWATDVSQPNSCSESWLDSRLAAKNLRTKERLWRRQNRRELTGLLYSPPPPHCHFYTPKGLIAHVCRSDGVKQIVNVSEAKALEDRLSDFTRFNGWFPFFICLHPVFGVIIEFGAATHLDLLDNYEFMTAFGYGTCLFKMWEKQQWGSQLGTVCWL